MLLICGCRENGLYFLTACLPADSKAVQAPCRSRSWLVAYHIALKIQLGHASCTPSLAVGLASLCTVGRTTCKWPCTCCRRAKQLQPEHNAVQASPSQGNLASPPPGDSAGAPPVLQPPPLLSSKQSDAAALPQVQPLQPPEAQRAAVPARPPDQVSCLPGPHPTV